MSKLTPSPVMATRSKGDAGLVVPPKDSPPRRKNPSLAGASRAFTMEKEQDGSLIYRRHSNSGNITITGMKRSTETSAESPNKKRSSDSDDSISRSDGTKQKIRLYWQNGCGEDVESDGYCWVCHKEGFGVGCELCPRMYHIRCLGIDEKPKEWVCPECTQVMTAESMETRSAAMKILTVDKLGGLLKYVLSRMRHTESEPFLQPVDLIKVRNYTNHVINPMDLSTMEKNIRRKIYGSTEAFLLDAKWILHNCIVFNGATHKYTPAAKSIIKICKHEMVEIEICPDCYFHSCTQRSEKWFCEPCRMPHPLVWAKMKGYPYWPAKALREANTQVDVRFFGDHERAWVPLNQVYLLSREAPTYVRAKKAGFDESMAEVEQHINRIKDKFGGFQYAPNKTSYDPKHKYRGGQVRDTVEELQKQQSKLEPIRVKRKSTSSKSPSPTYRDDIKEKFLINSSNNALDVNNESASHHSEEKEISDISDFNVQSLIELGKGTIDKEQEVIDIQICEYKQKNSPVNLSCMNTNKPDLTESNQPVCKKQRREELPDEMMEDEILESVCGLDKETEDIPEKGTTDNTGNTGKVCGKSEKNCETSTPDVSATGNHAKESSLSPPKSVFLLEDDMLKDCQLVEYPEKLETVVLNTKLQADQAIYSRIQDTLNATEAMEENEILPLPKSVNIEKTFSSHSSSDILQTDSNIDEEEINHVEDPLTSPIQAKKCNPLLEKIVATCKEKLGIDEAVETLSPSPSEVSSTSSSSSDGTGTSSNSDSRSSPSSVSSDLSQKESANENEEEDPVIIEAASEDESIHTNPADSSTSQMEKVSSVSILSHSQSPVLPIEIDSSPESVVNLEINCNSPPTEKDPKCISPVTSLKEIPAVVKTTELCTSKDLYGPNLSSQKNQIEFPENQAQNLETVKLSSLCVPEQPPTTASQPDHPAPSPICISHCSSTHTADTNSKSLCLVCNLSPSDNIIVQSTPAKSPIISPTENPASQSTQTLNMTPIKMSLSQTTLSTTSSPQSGGVGNPTTSRTNEAGVEADLSVFGFDFNKYTDRVITSLKGTFADMCNDLLKHEAAGDLRKHIQLQIERLKWQQEQQLLEQKHSADLQMAEMRSILEVEHLKAIEKLKKKTEEDKKKAIEKTKKTQWCANCGAEAIFYCCWNTSYCDYPCQQAHWPSHMASCSQSTNTSSGSKSDGHSQPITIHSTASSKVSKVRPPQTDGVSAASFQTYSQPTQFSIPTHLGNPPQIVPPPPSQVPPVLGMNRGSSQHLTNLMVQSAALGNTTQGRPPVLLQQGAARMGLLHTTSMRYQPRNY